MKNRHLSRVVTVIGLVVVLAGCDGLFKPPETDGNSTNTGSNLRQGNYRTVTQTGSVYQNLLDLTMNTVAAAVEKVLEYDPELTDSRSARSVRNRGGMDLLDFLLLTDLEKTKDGSPRSLGSTGVPTLEEELENIAAEFRRAIQDYVIDDFSFLDGINGFSFSDDGQVVYDGDILIPPDSIEGIIQLHILRSQITGEDMPEIFNDINMAASNYPSIQDGSRGLFTFSTLFWPNRRVFYEWHPDISPASKNLFTAAMADWRSKVPVEFIDIASDPNFFAKFMQVFSLGQVPLVMMESVTDPSFNAAGQAYVGGYKGRTTYCKIKDGLTGTSAVRTPRHELGHTLGLQHEHQRWDRDEYLTYSPGVLADTVNWGNVPPVPPGMLGTYYSIKDIMDINGIIIYLYLPRVSGVEGFGGTANFDYLSIMLYSNSQLSSMGGLKAKVAQQGLAAGSDIPYNTAISAGDTAAVNLMYGKLLGLWP